MPYYAHSDYREPAATGDRAHWQLLHDHLLSTAQLARHLALRANPQDPAFLSAAWFAGLLHDLGKYSDDFQARLSALAAGRPAGRVEHSGHGAVPAWQTRELALALAVAGHHAGLPAPQGDAASLRERVNRLQAEAHRLLQRARDDFASHGQDFPALAVTPPAKPEALREELRTRMLFSCLVDADRLDSAGRHLDSHAPMHAAQRLERLLGYVRQRAANAPDSPVKEARREVLEACLAAAEWPERLLTLTVPTGGGKTLSSMAFALRRLSVHPNDYRRIIVVIPYLSIIEQNADVYAAAVGDDVIVEHHSGAVDDAEDGQPTPEAHARALAVENWDAPIIITTSVRFFETLFSNRPRDLRRMHNIARSVVLLDEVQTLPRSNVAAILSMMQGLARDWGVTFVSMTATQPAFERRPNAPPNDPRWPPGTTREIAPSPQRLYTTLQRVRTVWPGQAAEPKRTPWEQLAQRIAGESRALCIVNLKRHAAALYELVRAMSADDDAVIHLSTRMCPQHRLDVINRIRNRLQTTDLPCRVISTQLVEAGVDLDFPVVYRAMGPLDSIAQAAGRCNREGKLPDTDGRPGGRVIVFEPDDEKTTPPGEYSEATAVCRQLAAAADLRIDNPDHIRGFFERYYAPGEGDGSMDPGNIQPLRRQFNFPAVSKAFAMIECDSQSVVVPYDDEVQMLLDELAATRQFDMHSRRRLQRYVVGLPPWELAQANTQGLIYELWPDAGIWVCGNGAYDDQMGFRSQGDVFMQI